MLDLMLQMPTLCVMCMKDNDSGLIVLGCGHSLHYECFFAAAVHLSHQCPSCFAQTETGVQPPVVTSSLGSLSMVPPHLVTAGAPLSPKRVSPHETEAVAGPSPTQPVESSASVPARGTVYSLWT